MNKLISILFFLSIQWNIGFASNILILNNNDTIYNVSNYLNFYPDSTSTLTIQQLIDKPEHFKFQKNNESPINLGVKEYNIWLMFDIENRSKQDDWILEIDYPTLNEVTLYFIDSENKLDTVIYSGKNRIDKQGQSYNYSIVLTPTFRKEKTQRVYIKVKTDSFIILPVSIVSSKTFIENDRKEFAVLYLLYGIILALVAFNFILFLLTFELNYLLLTIYLASLSLNAYYMYGYGFDLFPNLDIFIKNRMRQILFGVSSSLFMYFSINYLELRKYKSLYRVIVALIVISLFYIISLFFREMPQAFFSKYSPFLFLFGAIVNFYAGIYTYRRGERLALYYIISFSFVTISSVIYYLTLFNLIPFNQFTFNINSIGTVLFGLLLTIGLIEKITAIKQEKTKSTYLESMVKLLNKEIDGRIKVESSLRESEEKFKLIFDLSPQPITLTELDSGLIIDANKKMLELLGSSKNDIVGTTAISNNFIEVEERNRVIDEVRKNNFALGLDFKIKPPKAPVVNCLIYAQKATIQNTPILISVFIDITELKNNQITLERSAIQLRELNSTKDKFFAIIAHDLMNPFNAIRGFSQLQIEAINEDNKEDSLKYALLLEQSSLKITDLLQNLLMWSKSQSRKIVLTPTTINPIELIINAIDLFKSEALNKNIKFEFDIQLHESIYADSNMLSVVFRNLISNAIKYAHPESNIIISFLKIENEFLFKVKDFGIGIQPQLLNELFILDKTYKPTGKSENKLGLGLGLILCYDFVSLHNGRIWAESIVGKGSTFFFTIPISSK